MIKTGQKRWASKAAFLALPVMGPKEESRSLLSLIWPTGNCSPPSIMTLSMYGHTVTPSPIN